MPIDKRVNSAAEALADVSDGATVLISGFGGAGFANVLIRALRDHGAKNLTLVVNSATHRYSLTHELIEAGLVRKVVNPSDRRGVLVRLSAEGRRRLLRAFAFIRGVNDRLFAQVTGAEFEALTGFNRKFVRNTQATLAWIAQESHVERSSIL